LRGEAIINNTEKTELKEYLLGQLHEPDEDRVETRLLSDRQYGEEFDIVVSELTDQYVAGEIQGPERDQMERYFFASPARREKLRIAAALKEYKQHVRGGKRWVPSRELKVAASILIVFGLAFAVWWILKGDADLELKKGLAALQDAYREQRAVEPRVSALAYAPFSVRRGPEVDNSINDDLRRAELHLGQAVKDKPGPETYHALGKVYLAQGKPDEAIKQFEESLKGNQNNAQVYNDLGVAWLQKGDFNRSLDNFNKALQVDGNLQEALFNRALAYEKQSRKEEAKADWREYLKRDSSSPWAGEARQHLKLLDQ
jgi:tetratricopeptide (TPR) repeat protein